MEQKSRPTQKPPWLKKRISISDTQEMKKLLSCGQLHTICEEALCPNISECFKNKQASFLIMGSVCTRQCKFCNVTKGVPESLDPREAENLAQTVFTLGLQHVVITSPTRDDLADGGASHFALCIQSLRQRSPETRIEVLIPDFLGNRTSLHTVLDAKPDILSHNLETVERLYEVRFGAEYKRSLEVLEHAQLYAPSIPAKSGIMLGLGERFNEVVDLMEDLVRINCRMISIGQYLAPKSDNYPVVEYITPETFERYKKTALKLGFTHVESGPYVRSSYHAEKYYYTS